MIQTPPLPDQEFFTMGEVCRIAQVPAHTLRYWETRLGFLRPARRSSGHRRYSRNDLETLFDIKNLLQGKRLTMAGAKKVLLERKKGIISLPSQAEAEAAGVPAGTLKVLREVRKELKDLVAELSK